MRSTSFRKCLITLLTGSFLYGNVSCIPTRDQINSMLNSSILSGIGLAITLGVQAAVLGAAGLDTDGTD